MYFFILICIAFILYFFYQNTCESFISNIDEIKNQGWNVDNNAEGKRICNDGFSMSDGICCPDGQYNSLGVCCDYGLVNDGNGKCIVVDTKTNTNNEYNTKYDRDISRSIDTLYHESDITLMAKSEPTDVQFGNAIIFNDTGNVISYPSSSLQNSVTYYTPGSYPFGPSNYVPNYEDSIYLSKLTGQSTTKPIYNTSKMQKGFCSYFEDQPREKERICNQLSPDECASTNCCILLGGSKCVSGNESGPTMKTNYGDIFIKNKEFYYYQGKCYGNCQE